MLSLQMPPLLALGWAHWLFIIPICLSSIFLTLLILVQRGRGGGLTGALGGMGGQSAFGTKAGDVFTKITVATAMIWILLSMLALRTLHVPKFAGSSNDRNGSNSGTAPKAGEGTDPKAPPLTPEAAPATPGEAPPADAPAAKPPAAPSEPDPTPPAPAPAPDPAPAPPAESDK